MKTTLLLLVLLPICAGPLMAQSEPVFTVAVSTDSVLMNNYFSVTFTVENARVEDFSPPDFSEDFDLVSGPNMSSSMSIINGEMSQRCSYTFYLSPRKEGRYEIGAARVTADGDKLETKPLSIAIYPNPDGIRQEIAPKERDDAWGNDFFRNFEWPLLEPAEPDTTKTKISKRRTIKT